MDNSPLVYVQQSRLGISHVLLLSEYFLFDYIIRYKIATSNKATNALVHYPLTPDSSTKSKNESDVFEVIPCSSISDLVKLCLKH